MPERLISNLSYLYTAEIRVIYNLTDIPNSLVSYLWERHFEGTYVTELEGISIAIENSSAPNEDTVNLITKHIELDLANGRNILVHCEGGLGRTGTILAALHMVLNDITDSNIAIEYIREKYSKDAVENNTQLDSLRSFGSSGLLKTSSYTAIYADEFLATISDIFLSMEEQKKLDQLLFEQKNQALLSQFSFNPSAFLDLYSKSDELLIIVSPKEVMRFIDSFVRYSGELFNNFFLEPTEN